MLIRSCYTLNGSRYLHHNTYILFNNLISIWYIIKLYLSDVYTFFNSARLFVISPAVCNHSLANTILMKHTGQCENQYYMRADNYHDIPYYVKSALSYPIDHWWQTKVFIISSRNMISGIINYHTIAKVIFRFLKFIISYQN